MSLSQDRAEEVALRCLTWLVANEELLPVFMGSTGASLQDLKERAADPVFLGAVLDFLLMDDAWVVEFCTQNELPNERVLLARTALPGGDHTHWT